MCENHSGHVLDRRTVLRGAGAAAVVTFSAPQLFEPAAAAGKPRPGSRSTTHRGTFNGVGTPDWHYIPVDVPSGVREIEVSYDYQSTPTPVGITANVIDIGMFDPSGHDLGNAEGFRGWSGGARRSFRISRGAATPGYLPGPITPGRWHVVLGPFTVVPPGVDWTVTVTLHFGDGGPKFEATPAPRAVLGSGPGWYRGDLHLHTVHSDGRRSPAEMVAAARAAGLDYFVSTEHNTSSASLYWGQHAGTDLLVVNGEEVTTRDGHWLAVGLPAGAWIDWRYRSVDGALPRFLKQVRGLGGLAVIAHPSVPIPSTGWTQGPLEQADAIEVWNGPWTMDDEGTLDRWHEMLVAGTFRPAIGASDSHRPDQPVGLPQTVVKADDLSVGALVAALKAGRAWLAESSAVTLDLTAAGPSGSATCGERLAAGPADVVTIDLQVTGVPGCVATLIGPLGPIAVGQAAADGTVTLEQSLPAATAPFVRAEVRRPASSPADVPTDPTSDSVATTMVALTNPVFVGAPATLTDASTTPITTPRAALRPRVDPAPPSTESR
jgi:hypothetical protein